VHYFDAWRLPGEDRAVRAVHWYDRPGGVLSTFPDCLGDLASIQDVTTRSGHYQERVVHFRMVD
jgi:hypothetical protein